MRKKSYVLLVIGLILLVGGVIFAVCARNGSYQESIRINDQLTQIKALIKDVENGGTTGNLAELNAQKTALSEQKLHNERPYSYALILLFTGILFTLRGAYKAFIGTLPEQKADIRRLAHAGLLAALCYIGFVFFKIDLYVPGSTERASFHFGNVFCVLAALLLGGYWGGLAGAIGMTVGDMSTSYVTSAPKTFFLKLCIGLIVGLIAHKIFKLSRSHSARYVTVVTALSSACGMGFNIIADPVAGYFYKTYLLGVPQDLAKALAKISALTTSVNAVVAVFLATVFYLALRPALKKSGLFIQLDEEVPKI